MTFNLFSLLCGFLVVQIFIVLFIAVFSFKNVSIRLSPQFFIFLFLLTFLRMILPLEFDAVSYEINSTVIYPKLVHFLNDLHYIPVGEYSIRVSIFGLFVLIWLLGSLLLLFQYMNRYFTLICRLRHIPNTSDAQILEMTTLIQQQYHCTFSVKIIKNDCIPVPMEFGLFRQVILLPSYISAEALYFVLLHEMMHFKHKMNWLKLLLQVTHIIFWWNPLLALLLDPFDTTMECYCDRLVVQHLDFEEQNRYMKCMLAICKEKKVDWYPPVLTGFITNKKTVRQLKRRITCLLHRNKFSVFFNFTLTVLVFLIFLVSYRYIPQPYFEPPPSDLEPIECNESNSYFIYEEGIFYLYYQDESLIIMYEIPPGFEKIPIKEK